MNFFSHPKAEENHRIYIGLTRNKMLHGKRYCPCFMVIGETAKQKEEAQNRVCPCEPALKEEIPNEGKCHCGIFCTKEYTNSYNEKEINKKVMERTQKEGSYNFEKLFAKNEITGDELTVLLEARKNWSNSIYFN